MFVRSFQAVGGLVQPTPVQDVVTSSDMQATGVAPGIYNSIQVDAAGRAIGGVNYGYLTGNQLITLSGAVTGSGTTTIATTLAPSGVSAGTYGDANHSLTITVDTTGRVTAIVLNPLAPSGRPLTPADIPVQMSLVNTDPAGVKLSGDVAAPGNQVYYGTNQSGVHGFYPLPTSNTQGIWNYDNATAMADPGSGDLRSNNSAWLSATQLAVSKTSANGYDRSDILAALTTGDEVMVSDGTNAANWVRYTLSAPPINNTTWWLLPVSSVSAAGVSPPKNTNLMVTFTQLAGGASTMPGGVTGQLQFNNAGVFGGTAAGAYALTGNLFTFSAQVASDTPVVIKAAASQTGNLQTWQDNLGNVLACVAANGNIGIGVSAPTAGLSLVTPKPATVTTTPGTAGQFIFDTFVSATSGTGGDTTFGGSPPGSAVGGVGANAYLFSGKGGQALSAAVASTGGGGGTARVQSGGGGDALVAGTGNNTGGNAGALWLFGGTGGNATAATTGTNTSGNGGAVTIQAGPGGASSNGNTGNVAGSGGTITFQSGAGGSGTTSGGGGGAIAFNGGAGAVTGTGASISLTPGKGGPGTVAAGVAAVGGTTSINGGAGGNGAITNGGGGNVLIYAGATGTGAGSGGTAGSVLLRPGTPGGGTAGYVAVQTAAGINQIQANLTGLGFFAATPVAKPTVTGTLSAVTDANAKAVLTSLITALANLGLVTNSTT